VEIKDTSHIAFKAVIQYMYIGSTTRTWVKAIENNLDVLFQLICLSDKYFLHSLRSEIERWLDYFPVSSKNYATVFRNILAHQDLMGYDQLCSKLSKRCALAVMREWETDQDKALFLSVDSNDDPSLKQALLHQISEIEVLKCAGCDLSVSKCRHGEILSSSNCKLELKVRATADLTCETGRHDVPEGTKGIVLMFGKNRCPVMKDKKVRREFPFCCKSSKMMGFLAIMWFMNEAEMMVHAVDNNLLNIVVDTHE
jgi:hypothetical protein